MKKFIEEFNTDDWEIETDSGFQPILSSNKTIEYQVWEIETESYSLECADTHILFDENYNEIFVKDLIPHQTKIQTKSGLETIQSVRQTDRHEHMYDLEVGHPDHRFYTNDILSHNTTTIAGYAMWKILFTPSYKILILAHKHSMAKEILDRIKKSYEQLPFWMQQGILVWNKTNIELENLSGIDVAATTSDSGRGGTYGTIISDEFAFVKKTVSDDFMASVFPTISSGKNTQLIITSTPKGRNAFYQIFTKAKKGLNDFKAIDVTWRDIPGRDHQWEKEQRELIGDLKFDEEHEALFLGTQGSLLDVTTMKNIELTLSKPIRIEHNLKVYEQPLPNTSYIITVDVAEGVSQDFSAFSIFKIEKEKYTQVATFKDNSVKPELYSHYIVEIAKRYNDAYLMIELNSIGSEVAYIINQELAYQYMFLTKKHKNKQVLDVIYSNNCFYGMKTTSSTKNQGCMNLKTLFERNKLIIPDADTFDELTNFTSNGRTFQADVGYNDDLVMTLVLFAWVVFQPTFKQIEEDFIAGNKTSSNLIPNLMINNTVFFGNRRKQKEHFVDADGNVWFEV